MVLYSQLIIICLDRILAALLGARIVQYSLYHSLIIQTSILKILHLKSFMVRLDFSFYCNKLSNILLVLYYITQRMVKELWDNYLIRLWFVKEAIFSLHVGWSISLPVCSSFSLLWEKLSIELHFNTFKYMIKFFNLLKILFEWFKDFLTLVAACEVK